MLLQIPGRPGKRHMTLLVESDNERIVGRLHGGRQLKWRFTEETRGHGVHADRVRRSGESNALQHERRPSRAFPQNQRATRRPFRLALAACTAASTSSARSSCSTPTSLRRCADNSPTNCVNLLRHSRLPCSWRNHRWPGSRPFVRRTPHLRRKRGRQTRVAPRVSNFAERKVHRGRDVVTRGGRVQETIDIVRGSWRDRSAVGVIVDRSGDTKPDFGCPFVSLIEMNVETFPADNLPPDLAKIPGVKPGEQIAMPL